MPRQTGFEPFAFALLGRVIARALRQTLLRQELSFEDGRVQRWLPRDTAPVLQEMNDIADSLRKRGTARSPTFGNRLMVEMTVRTLAAYRALLDAGVSRVCARRLVADAGWDVYAAMLRLYALPARLTTRDPAKRIAGTIKLLLHFPFNAPGAPGYAVEHWVAEGNTYTHFTHCPPQSFVRALIASGDDRGDLEAFRESWCLYDWPGADIIADDGARGHYERRRTLSHGDDVCDMCWRGCAAA